MDDQRTIFLLNPPAGFILHRDYYCCTASKTGYIWNPIDLLVQMGYLSRRFRVEYTDAVAERQSRRKFVDRIASTNPDVVYSLVGSLCLEDDLSLLSGVRHATGAKIIVSGDVVLAGPKAMLEKYGFIDAVLLDFTCDSISGYIDGKAGPLDGLMSQGAPEARRPEGEFAYPHPDTSVFRNPSYNMPFTPRPFATVLASFGCPFRCTFCNSGADSIGFRLRETENLKEEIISVKSTGIGHIFFKDMTFGTNAARRDEICRTLSNEATGMSWHAYTRIDLLNEDILKMYADCGCRLLQVGIETTSPAAESAGKKYDADRAREVVALAAANGIKIGAHYITGLPGEDLADTLRTAFFARRLKTDYASFNSFSPRPGSALYGKRVKSGGKFLKRIVIAVANLIFYFRLSAFFEAKNNRTEASARSLFNLLAYLLKMPDVR